MPGRLACAEWSWPIGEFRNVSLSDARFAILADLDIDGIGAARDVDFQARLLGHPELHRNDVAIDSSTTVGECIALLPWAAALYSVAAGLCRPLALAFMTSSGDSSGVGVAFSPGIGVGSRPTTEIL